MDSHIDNQKGLEWLAEQNRDLKLENEKIRTQLFFYKKNSDESKQTISRMLKNPNETGYIFLSESARSFLNFLLKENTKMNEAVKQSELTANAVNIIEQKRKIDDLQNQMNILNDEISCLKQVKNNDEKSLQALCSKISSLSKENYHLKIRLLNNTDAMDYLQSTLKDFQSKLVETFCDLYQKNGENFLKKLEENNYKFSECFSLNAPENSVEKGEIDRLNAENNDYKRKITKLEEDNEEAENNLHTVLESLTQTQNKVKDLEERNKDLEQKLVFVKKENESLNKTLEYFEKCNKELQQSKISYEKQIKELQKKIDMMMLHDSFYKSEFSQEPYTQTQGYNPGMYELPKECLVSDGGGSVMRDSVRSREPSVATQKFPPSTPGFKTQRSQTDSLQRSYEQVNTRYLENFDTAKSTQTSPTKDECVYCGKLYPPDLLQSHTMKCKAEFERL